MLTLALGAGPVVPQGPPWWPGLGVFAVLLAALHILAPSLRRWFEAHGPTMGSCGGGLAVAYVFLQLIPELDEGHELLGRLIFVIPLAAFVLFYGLDKFVRHHSSRKGVFANFNPGLGRLWVYNWLIVYGVPAEALEVGWRALPLILALGLHLVHADFALGRENPGAFDRVGRYVLAPAPIVAWLMIVTVETRESVSEIFVAILAGTLLHQVFAEELPEERESRYLWFVAGVVVFSVVAAWTW